MFVSGSGGRPVKVLYFIAPKIQRQDRREGKSKGRQDSMFATLKQYKDSSESEKLLLTIRSHRILTFAEFHAVKLTWLSDKFPSCNKTSLRSQTETTAGCHPIRTPLSPRLRTRPLTNQSRGKKPVNQQNTGQTEGVTGDNDLNSDRAWDDRCHTAYPSQSRRLGKHGVLNVVQHILPV